MNKLQVNGRPGTAAKSPSKLNTARSGYLGTPARAVNKNSSFISQDGGSSMGAKLAGSLKSKVGAATPTRIVNPCKLPAILQDCNSDGYWYTKAQETLMLFLNDRKEEVEEILSTGVTQVNMGLENDGSKEFMIEDTKFK